MRKVKKQSMSISHIEPPVHFLPKASSSIRIFLWQCYDNQSFDVRAGISQYLFGKVKTPIEHEIVEMIVETFEADLQLYITAEKIKSVV